MRWLPALFAAALVPALAVALLPTCGAVQTQTVLASEAVVVPFTQHGGHVVVDVWIGERGPYLFQVDTYASIDACLDDDLAAELDLPVTGQARNSDGLTTSTRDLVTIPELRLGDASFRDLRTLVDDYSWLGTRRGRPVQGLVGFTAFDDLLVTFDYPGSRLVLERGALAADGPGVLPYTTESGAPDVRLAVGERELELGIDTGFDGTLLLDLGLADELPLATAPRKVGTARVAYTTFDLHEARLLDALHIAGRPLHRLEVLFREGATQNLVGRGVLRHFATTFDQRRQLVRFARPGELAAVPTEGVASGGDAEGGEDGGTR